MGKYIPSFEQAGHYWAHHKVAGTLIAFTAIEALRIVWASAVNPRGQSPLSSYGRPNYKELGAVDDGPEAWMKHEMASNLGMVRSNPHCTGTAGCHCPTCKGSHGMLGASTSTTTSTSSSHAMMARVNAPNTWDSHSKPGDKLPMFGQPKHKAGLFRGPPAMRRRVFRNLSGSHPIAPQDIDTSKADGLPESSHLGLLGMMPEQDPEGTDITFV